MAKVSTPKQFRNVLDNTQIDREGNLLIGSKSENLPTVALLNLQTKKWLRPDQIRLSHNSMISDVRHIPKNLFASTSSENCLPLSGLLLGNYDSPELVDAAQSKNLCIYFAKNLTAVQQSLKDQIVDFFEKFFNDTPSDLDEITKMLGTKGMGIFLIGHFSLETAPIIFSLLVFKRDEDEKEDVPIILEYLTTAPFLKFTR